MIRNKAFMRDPATANCRVYLGNLELNTSEEDVLNRFSQHGKILGVNIQRQFGFIQYEMPESATKAIEIENGAMFNGRNINVRPVLGEGKGKQPIKPAPIPAPPQDLAQEEANMQEPTEDVQQPHEWNNVAPRNNRGGGRGGRGGGNYRDRSPINRERFVGGTTRRNFRNDDNYGYSGGDDRPPYRVTPNSPFYKGPKNAMSQPRSFANRNDCEIIVVARSLTDYAEYIEHRLKSLYITVDLLFPNNDIPLGKVLANISSNGSLYAILITPQNEEHKSLTLNILHGLPQEHRNMPIEDAMQLIKRDFEAHNRGEKLVPGSVTVGQLSDKHPEAVQVLLNLLAENRQLTVLQYDRIIKYLQNKREQQLKVELGDASEMPNTPLASDPKAAELQNRILSILNSNMASGSAPVSAPTSEPTSNVLSAENIQKTLNSVLSQNALDGTRAAPAESSMQKVLDSLLHGDLFKNLTAKK